MKPEFVPFLAHNAEGQRPKTEARTEIVTGAKCVAPFVPLAQSQCHTAAATPGQAEPLIKLEREGDRIICITIQCPCGNVIELACEQ